MTRQAKEYRVEVTTLQGASSLRFTAYDANGAKKQARAYMRDYCGHGRYDGKATYRALVTA